MLRGSKEGLTCLESICASLRGHLAMAMGQTAHIPRGQWRPLNTAYMVQLVGVAQGREIFQWVCSGCPVIALGSQGGQEGAGTMEEALGSDPQPLLPQSLQSG